MIYPKNDHKKFWLHSNAIGNDGRQNCTQLIFYVMQKNWPNYNLPFQSFRKNSFNQAAWKPILGYKVTIPHSHQSDDGKVHAIGITPAWLVHGGPFEGKSVQNSFLLGCIFQSYVDKMRAWNWIKVNWNVDDIRAPLCDNEITTQIPPEQHLMTHHVKTQHCPSVCTMTSVNSICLLISPL